MAISKLKDGIGLGLVLLLMGLTPRELALTIAEQRQALRKDALSAENAAKTLLALGPQAEPAMPDLIGALRYDEPATAKAIQDVLVAVGPSAVAPLVRTLGDSNFIVRLRAVETLGRLNADSPRAVSVLTGLLTDPSFEVRSAAETALVHVGPPAVTAVAAAMRKQQGSNRKIYLDVLPKLGPAAAPVLIGVVLRDENAFLRAAAVSGLAQLQPVAGETVPALMHALADLQEVVRAEAADALGDLKEAAQPAMGLLTVISFTDQDPLVRQKASQAIEVIGPAGSTAMPGLVSAFRHESQDIRISALRHIVSSDIAYSDIQHVIQLSFQDGNPKVRLALVEALAAHRKEAPETAVLLNAALQDASAEVRIAAEAALHPPGTKSAPIGKRPPAKKKP